MRKKFTMLLASLFLVIGTAWAQTNSYTRIETFESARTNSTVYALKATRSPLYFNTVNNELAGYWTSSSQELQGGQADATNVEQQFAFLRTEKTAANMYYMYSVKGECFITALGKKSETPVAIAWLKDVTDKDDTNHQGMKLYLGNTGDNVVNMTYWNNNTAGGVRYNINTEADAGNVFEFIAYDNEVDLATAVEAIKEVEGGDEEVDIYAVHENAQGGRTHAERSVKIISLTSNLSEGNAANATTLTHDGKGLKYIDMTETVTMKAYANEPVTAAVTLYNGHWIHAYVYIDLDQDGFTAGVDTDGYTPTGDLMTYSCYSINTQNWYNKDGAVANNNTLVMPKFHAPTTPGTYRMRFKTDWNNIIPDGGPDSNNNQDQFGSAGGTIIDVTLVVEEAPTNYTVKYDFVYNDEVKYSQVNEMLLVGAEYPEITVTHPYGVVSAAKPTGVVDGSEAVSGVITKEIALSVQGLPFELSDSYANAVWYYMPLHNSDKNYLSYAENQEFIPLRNDQKVLPAEGHDAYLWAFVGDPFTGYKIMNKAAGETKILSSATNITNDANTHPVMIVETSLPEGNNTYWIPTASSHATNGFFLAQKGYSNNRMNRRDGKLAYWTGGADGGSTFRVTTIAEGTDFESIVSQKAFAGKVGYPKLNSNEYTALAGWVQGRTTKLDAEVAISNFKKSSNIVLPEDGKAYTIANFSLYNGGTTRYLNYTKDAALSVKEEGEPSVFVCKMLSNGAYTFVTEDGKVLTWMHSDDGYKGDGAFRGYSENYATEYSNYSDWNRITVKKNGTTETDFGHLRLVARRNASSSSFIIQGDNGNWDRAGDSYFLDTPQADPRCFSSAWILTEVEHANTDAENLAIAKIGALDVRYELLAEGIGGYHYEIEGLENYSKDVIYNATSVDAVNNIASTFAINQPAAGFYRIKSMNGNNAEKKGRFLEADATGMKLAKNGGNPDNKYTSVFYVKDNTILSYSCGQYLNSFDAFAVVGAEPTSWVIEENAAIVGTYALKYEENANRNGYLSDWLPIPTATEEDPQPVFAPTNGLNDGNAAWTLEAVEWLPVPMNTEIGWATYYAPVQLALSSNRVKAYTGTVEGDWLTLTEQNVIPANEGVVLEYQTGAEVEDGCVFLQVQETKVTVEDNAFRGTHATQKANNLPDEGTIYTLQPYSKEGYALPVAFMEYYDEENENIPNLKGFRAYLPLEGGQNAIGIRFEGSTDIENVEIRNQHSEMIFDLLGRRVEAITKGGIYIVNGKKVVIK